MTSAVGAAIDQHVRGLLRDCETRWGLPGFSQSVRVEWARRFRRSLGRVHLEHRVVRLSAELAVAPITVLLEVLCHEAAHLAAKDLYGRGCKPHGPEWGALVRTAGFEPRRSIPSPTLSPPSPRSGPLKRRYTHRCPVCQLQRTAWRRVKEWRCAPCVAAGLPGRLEITPGPTRGRA